MKRTDWIIAGFLAVLILGVVGGFLIFWLQSQAALNQPISQDTYERGGAATAGITADDAFLIANQAAFQWQADAQLVSAAATIVRFNELQDIYGGRTNWNVVYYSPSTSSLATYVVTPNGASLLNAKSIDFVPLTISPEQLALNSGQAMTLAMANGGDAMFVGEAQRVAHMSVEKKPIGTVEWQIVIQNETSGVSGQYRIDATTGELLVESE